MQKPYIVLSQYPYECEIGSSPDISVTHVLHERDASLPEMLEFCETFIRACGWTLDGSLIVQTEEEAPPHARTH
mgnify:FL=1|jgi:hypothetical protein